MKKAKYKIVFNKSEKNNEFFVQIFHKNGKEILKETYKNKAAVKKIVENFLRAIVECDYDVDYSKVDVKK